MPSSVVVCMGSLFVLIGDEPTDDTERQCLYGVRLMPVKRISSSNPLSKNSAFRPRRLNYM